MIEDYKSFSDQNLVPTIVISFYLLTVKLSVLPVFVFVMLLFCLKYKSIKIAQLRILFISSVVIILPWLIRNIIISGWLVYPMASVDFFNFDWKVPISLVVSESNSIVGWARNPGADYLHSLELNAFSWMSIWWENQVLSIKIILVCCLVFSFFNLIYALFKKNSILSMPNILLITSFLGIVFWLFTAPDFRFGFPFIVLNFWIIVLNIKSDLKYKYSRFIVLIILIVLPLYSVKRETLEFLNSGGNSIIIPKGFKEQSSLKFDIRQIKGGSIFIPTKSDQCFNCALPCTPYYNKDLEFRVSDNPIFGFRHK